MPEYFDEQVIAQRKREAEDEQWLCEHIWPLLDRVYGVDPPVASACPVKNDGR